MYRGVEHPGEQDGRAGVREPAAHAPLPSAGGDSPERTRYILTALWPASAGPPGRLVSGPRSERAGEGGAAQSGSRPGLV